MKVESIAPTTHNPTNCTIITGEWTEPYTGRSVTSASSLQIDHLVALADAERSGGWAWPSQRKAAFANNLDDPDALNAVWGPENERKSDSGPDKWVPPAENWRCRYVAAYARIKVAWDLTVTAAQAAAITRVLGACPL